MYCTPSAQRNGVGSSRLEYVNNFPNKNSSICDTFCNYVSMVCTIILTEMPLSGYIPAVIAVMVSLSPSDMWAAIGGLFL